MIQKPINTFVLAALALSSAFALIGEASAECLEAKGKITNNAQPLDGTTLGVVALNINNDKFKCGIHGVPTSPYSFNHTIVCDDKAAAGESQAQITFSTIILSQAVTGYCPEGSTGGPVSFSFTEVSTPIASTGRGAFKNVTSGSINVQGTYNCQGGIVMDFKGQMCFGD